jgi:hypothetical protein
MQSSSQRGSRREDDNLRRDNLGLIGVGLRCIRNGTKANNKPIAWEREITLVLFHALWYARFPRSDKGGRM